MNKVLNYLTAIGGRGSYTVHFYTKLYKKTATTIFLRNKGIKQYIPVNLSTKLMTFFIQIGINSSKSKSG
jgi:hypothetical protein